MGGVGWVTALAVMAALLTLAGCGATGGGSLPTASSPSPAPGECVTGPQVLFPADARGSKGDPIELARATLHGLLPTDTLGRIDLEGVVVQVFRDGRRIGRLHYLRDPDGGWILAEVLLCEGLGLSES